LAGDSAVVPTLRGSVEAPDLRSRFLARRGLEELGIEVDLPDPPTPAMDWDRLSTLGRHPTLVVTTERGEIRLRLDAEAAPQTVQSLTSLAGAGRFDGVPFHRVETNFVIQGGDLARGTAGEPADFVLRSEFNGLPYLRGTLGMASAGKDTETSQFFVTHLMTPHLDGRYTVFGWVVDGMEVVDAVRQEDRILGTDVVPGVRVAR
jgi:peptidylprolyl isomerase